MGVTITGKNGITSRQRPGAFTVSPGLMVASPPVNSLPAVYRKCFTTESRWFCCSARVCFWHLADISITALNVRFRG
jgi:hypothetical protein